MEKTWRARDFVCPYYRRARGRRVDCEGGCRVELPDQAAFDRYAAAYCAHLPGWERCTLAQARTRYYDEKSGQ